jgi:hypothetical protein
MLAEPNCWKRKCKHFIGILQPDGTELTERNVCEAFPDMIPEDIAYGNNRHLEPLQEQDNNIVYERKED